MMPSSSSTENLRQLGLKALDYVRDGYTIGLGSGRASTAFVEALGGHVRAGLKIRGVPTSQATAEVAMRVGVPLISLDQVERLDVAVDGADEVDPRGNLIKGFGGALVREKIVAASATMFVILVDSSKLVNKLGERGRLPVEVVPFGLTFVQRQLAKVGYPSLVRTNDGATFVTDNGNVILDVTIGPLDAAESLEVMLNHLPGVVGTGLFLNWSPTVLVQTGEKVVVLGDESRVAI